MLAVAYEGLRIDGGYRIDLLVDGSIIVELKAVPEVLPVHRAQVLTYLKLSGLSLALLLNFHGARMTNGIHRIVRSP